MIVSYIQKHNSMGCAMVVVLSSWWCICAALPHPLIEYELGSAKRVLFNYLNLSDGSDRLCGEVWVHTDCLDKEHGVRANHQRTRSWRSWRYGMSFKFPLLWKQCYKYDFQGDPARLAKTSVQLKRAGSM